MDVTADRPHVYSGSLIAKILLEKNADCMSGPETVGGGAFIQTLTPKTGTNFPKFSNQTPRTPRLPGIAR